MNRSEEYPLVCPMNCPMCLAPFNDVKILQRHLHDVHFWPVHGTFVHQRKRQLCHSCQQSTDHQQASKKIDFRNTTGMYFSLNQKTLHLHWCCFGNPFLLSKFFFLAISDNERSWLFWSLKWTFKLCFWYIRRLKFILGYHWWHEFFNEVKLHSNTTLFVYDEGPSTSIRKRPSTNQWGHTGPGNWWKNWLQERYQYFCLTEKYSSFSISSNPRREANASQNYQFVCKSNSFSLKGVYFLIEMPTILQFLYT